jgi:LysM repeat protein
MEVPMKTSNRVYVIVLTLVAVLVVSCGTTTGLYRNAQSSSRQGVWHRVEQGQTLWRIAKTYRVSLEEIKDANDIEDVVHVSTGTWVFIPDAQEVLYVQGSVSGSPPDLEAVKFTWPVQGEIVRSFGKDQNDFNYGIDVETQGSSNVRAAEKGKVVISGIIRGYGKTIIIEHDNDFISLYSRDLQSFVKEGQSVDKNSVIAKIETPRNSEKAVVHYELFYKGKPVNPLYYLP